MTARDSARNDARLSNSEQDWSRYRGLKNDATSAQRKDKNNYWKNAFSVVDDENDSEKMFSMTTKLLGWKMNGPPCSFTIKGRKKYKKQKYLAEIQASFYKEKVLEIKNGIPRFNFDPLLQLKRAFER